MKKNIVELNVVKAIAILAVVLIHVTADPRGALKWGEVSAPFYLMANQLSMFAVPVFILINGLVLFYRYHDDWSYKQALTFYKKRIQYIVIPYLVWSAIYYMYRPFLNTKTIYFDLKEYLALLPWGEAGYHTYFMVIVIQLYIMFPILMTIVKKLKFKPYHMVILGLVVKGIFYYINRYVDRIEHAAALIPNYFIVFCVGAAIGMAYQSFSEKYIQVWWTFGLAITVGFTYILAILSAQSGGYIGSLAYNILYNSYAVLMGISLIWIGKIVCDRSPSAFVTKGLLGLGAASFGIYLIHPAILSTWGKFMKPELGSPYFHVYYLGTFLLVLALSWLIVHFTKKIKFSWLLWGR
ncbi:acyltransferase [Paenibacillus sp. GCM10027627]|uniref:acyltransferase n=1 Tax=unclassified Paenibacillus TaxID=185978 RepID=UPI0036449BBA